MLSFLIGSPKESLAQRSMVKDALTLSTIVSNNSGHFWITKDTKPLLDYYYGNLNNAQYDIIIPQNPFLNPFFETSGGAQSEKSSLNLAGLNLASAASSIGSLDVTTYADGFAKFLVARTKEELSVAFFQRFKDLLEDPKYKDAQTLFPQTYALLEAIDKQIYNYQTYISALREAFEKDLNTLLFTLPDVINDQQHTTFFNSHPELKAALLTATYIAGGLQKKEQPGTIIANYDVSNLDGLKNKDFKGAVMTLKLLSESFRSLGSDHYWIDKDSLQLLVNDKVALRIYLGLIYQKADGITFQGTTTLKGALKQIADTWNAADDRINGITAYLMALNKKTTIVTDAIKSLEKKDSSKLTFTDYYSYYTAVLDLIDYASTTDNLLNSGDTTLAPEVKSYTSVARIGGNVALDITRRNYSSAMLNVYLLYTAKIGGTTLGDESPLIKDFVLKYGAFISGVVQAQNSDDVEKAIEAAALPPGSASIKKNSCFDIALSSYVGGFWGNEYLGDKISGNWRQSTGMNAPIGVSLSWGLGKEWAASAFLSLVDLGALTSYRLQDSTTAPLPVKLGDIFAPGGGIAVGFPNLPISIGYMFQFGPSLREVSASEKVATGNLNNRWYFFVGVDIPLFDLYNLPNQ